MRMVGICFIRLDRGKCEYFLLGHYKWKVNFKYGSFEDRSKDFPVSSY